MRQRRGIDLAHKGLWAGVVVFVLGPTGAAAQQKTTRTAAAAPSTGITVAPVAFKGVTVVDVETGKLLPDQTVVIDKNRIGAMGKDVQVPAGARVVDAQGKYLIPGLWNMHSHLIDQIHLTQSRYEDFIVNGVTGTREMAQRFPGGADSFRIWQPQIMAGTRIGPRIVGPSADLNQIPMESPADVARVMDSLKAAGMVFVKYHGGAERDMYFAMTREARRVGLPLVGHSVSDVTETEQSDSGQKSLEHMNEVHTSCWFDPDTTLAEACATMAAHFKKNGTWFVPTLVRFDPFDNYEGPSRGCRPDSLRANMPLDAGAQPVGGVDVDGFVGYLKALGKMHRAGIPLLPGSDGGAGPDGSNVDIFACAFHVELALFVEAGLTPLETLQSATLSPAKFFNMTDSLGTVAPGKLADLVLLNANPLADIHNAKKIYGVMVNGHYFDRAKLDSIQAKHH